MYNLGNSYTQSKYGAEDVPQFDKNLAPTAIASSFNPYVLAATVGLNLLQQRAQDERARRERSAQIEQGAAQGEQNQLNSILNNYGKALL